MSYGATTAGKMASVGTDFTDTATVTDMDIWYDPNAKVQQSFGNQYVSISQTINSGTVVSGPDHSYEAPTGKHTWVYTIRSKTNSTYDTQYYTDSFQGTDNGAAAVRDPQTPWFTVSVGIPGMPKTTPPGGHP